MRRAVVRRRGPGHRRAPAGGDRPAPAVEVARIAAMPTSTRYCSHGEEWDARPIRPRLHARGPVGILREPRPVGPRCAGGISMLMTA